MSAKTVVWTGVSPFEGFVGTFEERAALLLECQKARAVVSAMPFDSFIDTCSGCMGSFPGLAVEWGMAAGLRGRIGTLDEILWVDRPLSEAVRDVIVVAGLVLPARLIQGVDEAKLRRAMPFKRYKTLYENGLCIGHEIEFSA